MSTPMPPASPPRVATSRERARAATALAARLDDGRPHEDAATDAVTDALDGVSDDPLLATYHLATLAPIGPADRLRLLSADGPMHRLDLLDEILDDVEAMMKFRLS